MVVAHRSCPFLCLRALKRLTLVAVTRGRLSYARMPKTDHSDGAGILPWSGATVAHRAHRPPSARIGKATNLNRQVMVGVGTT